MWKRNGIIDMQLDVVVGCNLELKLLLKIMMMHEDKRNKLRLKKKNNTQINEKVLQLSIYHI